MLGLFAENTKGTDNLNVVRNKENYFRASASCRDDCSCINPRE
jgi:hypothetical protein